jgi:HK97 family phage major capsid protein
VTRSAGAPPADIVRLCAAHSVPQTRAAEFIEKGYSLEAAKAAIFDERSTRGATGQPPAEVRLDGMPEKDRRKYSFARAVRQAVLAKEGGGSFDGLEAEVSEEIERQTPSTYRGIGGHFVPMSLLSSEQRAERDAKIHRAMGSGVSGGGAELVFDRAGDLIDLLRNRMLTARFGAQVLSGLTGPVQFPVQTGDPTAYFVGENPAAGVAASQLTFGTRLLSPKEAIAVVPFPRRLVNMASVDIESRVRNSLIAKHALLWDRMGLHGRGTDGEPTGIYNTPGVATVAFGSTVPTYGKLVDLGSAIADANADTDTMRYMTTPTMAGKLKQTLVASAAGAAFIWNGTFRDGEMAGYGAGSTKQIRADLGAGRRRARPHLRRLELPHLRRLGRPRVHHGRGDARGPRSDQDHHQPARRQRGRASRGLRCRDGREDRVSLMRSTRVRVTRSHVLGAGRYAEVGDILDLPEHVAVERIGNGSCEPAPAPPEPAPEAPAGRRALGPTPPARPAAGAPTKPLAATRSPATAPRTKARTSPPSRTPAKPRARAAAGRGRPE